MFNHNLHNLRHYDSYHQIHDINNPDDPYHQKYSSIPPPSKATESLKQNHYQNYDRCLAMQNLLTGKYTPKYYQYNRNNLNFTWYLLDRNLENKNNSGSSAYNRNIFTERRRQQSLEAIRRNSMLTRLTNIRSNFLIESSDPYDYFHNQASKSFLVLRAMRKYLNEQESYQTDEHVIINVSGLRFETKLRTLERYPNTLLGNSMKRSPYFDSSKGEYFFNRNRPSFDAILYYYQSGGRIHRPVNIPVDIFTEELFFYQIDDDAVQIYLQSEGYEKPETYELPSNPIKRKLHLLLDHPESSIFARLLALFSLLVTLLSIVTFCVETLPHFRTHYKGIEEYFEETNALTNLTKPIKPLNTTDEINFFAPFFIIETACIAFFTVELLIRFCCCPNVLRFVFNFLNVIDAVAIIPYFVQIIATLAHAKASFDSRATVLTFLRVVKLIRVFRILRLSRHSKGLQIFGHTINSSKAEISLLLFFFMICTIIFSSAVYVMENGLNNSFTSVPDAFWWAIITMTTVGYGDMFPVSPLGKVVGSCCAIVGLLVLSLPVPVIVSNFNFFYKRYRDSQQNNNFLQFQIAREQDLVHLRKMSEVKRNKVTPHDWI